MPLRKNQKLIAIFEKEYKRITSLSKDYINRSIAQVQKVSLSGETAVKLFIPLFVIVGGFYACSSSQKIIQRNIDEIFKVSDLIRERYTDKPDYWGLSTEAVINEHNLPSSYIKDGKLYISGNREIRIGNGINADIIMPRSKVFDVVLPNLNKAQCISFVEEQLPEDGKMKLIQLSLVNKSGEYILEWDMKARKAEKICAEKNNTLIWTLQ